MLTLTDDELRRTPDTLFDNEHQGQLTVVTTNGQPVVLAVGTERQFQRLCSVLQLEELLQHPHFQTNKTRVEHRAALNERLAGAIQKTSLDVLMLQFREQGIPAARVRDMRGVFDLPAAQAMILEENTVEGIPTKRVQTVAFRLETGA